MTVPEFFFAQKFYFLLKNKVLKIKKLYKFALKMKN